MHFNSADISDRLPESTHISRRRLEFSRLKLLEIRMVLFYKSLGAISLGEISSRKKDLSEKVC